MSNSIEYILSNILNIKLTPEQILLLHSSLFKDTDTTTADNDTPDNTKYKDSVFRTYFKDRDIFLSLYSFLSKTEYDKDIPAEDISLEHTFTNGRKNDVGYLVDNKLVVLMEHQSTFSYNLPLRYLFYISITYEKMLYKIGPQKLYQKKAVKLPNPDFIVLYNGPEPLPNNALTMTLNLSDCFITYEPSPSLELRVKLVDINYKRNPKYVSQNKGLREYCLFVSYVESYREAGLDTNQAIKQARKRCEEEEILSDYLAKYGKDVNSMLFDEISLEDIYEVIREEEREEAEARGEAKGKLDIARNLLDTLDTDTIALKTGLPLPQIKQLRAESKTL